jgi:hypothetical protein
LAPRRAPRTTPRPHRIVAPTRDALERRQQQLSQPRGGRRHRRRRRGHAHRRERLRPAGQFVYDASIFHIEALFGFNSAEVGGGNDRATVYVFGAGGWYHLHRGASSDFSVGALIAINTNSGPGASNTVTAFEPGRRSARS